MSKAAAVQKLNEKELKLGLAGTSASWHQEHINSPTIYIGGLPPNHDESHILAIFEQYGTILHLNLVRHAETKKSKQFAFAMYADPRSAILAVDNLNAIQLYGHTLRVDHVGDYRLPDPSDAFDTTPHYSNPPLPHKNLQQQTFNRVAPSSDDPGEHLREEAVMYRLKKLQKRRRIDDPGVPPSQPAPPPTGSEPENNQKAIETNDNNPTAPPATSDAPLSSEEPLSIPQAETEDERNERRRRRIEKDKRRAKRAAIRKARAERRARRQDQQSSTP